MQSICLFPGTFDPITLGHVDIINRAVPLFDKIIVAVGINAGKAPMFTPEQRQHWIEEIFKGPYSPESGNHVYTENTIANWLRIFRYANRTSLGDTAKFVL